MEPQDAREKIAAAQEILNQDSTTVEKVQSLAVLLKGINPKINKLCDSLSKTLSTLQKLQKGEVIELTAENLPEETKEQKKRKKAILFLIRSLKELRSEVNRVKQELEKTQGKQKPGQNQAKTLG